MENLNVNGKPSYGLLERMPARNIHEVVSAKHDVVGFSHCMHSFLPSALLLLILLSISPLASATSIIVNTFSDGMVSDGQCSITEAIQAANTNTSVDSCPAGQSSVVDGIIIAGQGTIEVASTLIVTESLLITGVNPSSTVLDGRNQRQIFRIAMDDMTDDFTLVNMTLQRARGGNTTSSLAGGAVQLFQGNQFVFQNIHFINNFDTQDGGGAIYAGPLSNNDNARLRITNCSFIDNSALQGGGAIYSVRPGNANDIRSLSNLTVQSTEFIRNRDRNETASSSVGGAIRLNGVGTVSIEDSQFVDNQVPPGNSGSGTAGAISVSSSSQQNSTVFINGTSFIGNSAATSAGAVLLFDVSAILENNSFTMNEVTSQSGSGSALVASGSSSADIRYSTFYENGDNTGDDNTVFCNNCSLSMLGNIIWTLQPTDNECEIATGSLVSLGGNIDGSGSCATSMDDLPMTDPLLLPLGDYADDVDDINLLTMPPRSSSPAIDLSGENGSCPAAFSQLLTHDQRNFQRPRVVADTQQPCDAGAVEFQPGTDPVDQRLNVIFIGDGAGQVADLSGVVDCDDSCSRFFASGTMVTLQASPAPGSRFIGWRDVCTGVGDCDVTVNTTRTAIAEFEQITFPLSIGLMGSGFGQVTSDTGNIDCPATSCTDDFPMNTLVRLSAVTDPGSVFVQWQSCDSQVNGDCLVTIDRAREVFIVFGREDQALNIDFIGNGSGLVRSADVPPSRVFGGDEITCDSDCTAMVPFNLLVNLEAVADADSEFIGWGGACTGMDLCTIRMDQMRNVTAEFVQTGFSLEVILLGEGDGAVNSDINGINCPGSCRFTFPLGTEVRLTASAIGNSVFSNWSDDCIGTQMCSVSMDQNRRVIAVFNEINPDQIFINSFE